LHTSTISTDNIPLKEPKEIMFTQEIRSMEGESAERVAFRMVAMY